MKCIYFVHHHFFDGVDKILCKEMEKALIKSVGANSRPTREFEPNFRTKQITRQVILGASKRVEIVIRLNAQGITGSVLRRISCLHFG